MRENQVTVGTGTNHPYSILLIGSDYCQSLRRMGVLVRVPKPPDGGKGQIPFNHGRFVSSKFQKITLSLQLYRIGSKVRTKNLGKFTESNFWDLSEFSHRSLIKGVHADDVGMSVPIPRLSLLPSLGFVPRHFQENFPECLYGYLAVLPPSLVRFSPMPRLTSNPFMLIL